MLVLCLQTELWSLMVSSLMANTGLTQAPEDRFLHLTACFRHLWMHVKGMRLDAPETGRRLSGHEPLAHGHSFLFF